jgi:hypothetical protein
MSISAEINQALAEKTRVVKVINHAFGDTVTVAGLLNSSDIIDQINLKNEIPALSSNIFNNDNITIDGMSKEKMKKIFNGKLAIIDEEFTDWTFS